MRRLQTQFISILLILAVGATAEAKSRKRKSATKSTSSSQVRLKKVGSCKVVDGVTKKVMILKQWHLAPTTITKGFKEKYPHERNQTAIYKALEDGVKDKSIQLIISEGCEGEINSEFTPTFNGWDYKSLKDQSYQKSYSKTLTLIPLKVEAKYTDRIATFCGDNHELIQEGNLRLSNLRGWLGFYTRFKADRDNREKIQPYIESAAELLNVSKDTSIDKLLIKIKDNVKTDLEAFVTSVNDRNKSFVKALSDHEFEKAAIVIGGLHAEDLKSKLENAGFGCDIYEPPGYQREDENLINEFRRTL